MKKLWHKISYLGVEDNSYSLEKRSIILKNQINAVMLLVMLFFITFSTIVRELDGGKMTLGTFRLDLLALVNLLVMYFSVRKKHNTGKILLIYMPTFIIIILPFIFNFIENETYFFNPMIIIGFSIVTPLILVPANNRVAYSLSIIYFVTLLALNKTVLVALAPDDLDLIEHIKTFDINYDLVPVAVLLFIHLGIYYLRNLNTIYEKILAEKNRKINLAINNLKKTQQQLIQAEKMASVGNLTSGVAHEINNPLNFITGGIYILKQNMKNLEYRNEIQEEKIAKSLSMIEEGNKKATDIVAALMTFSFRGVSKLQHTKIEDIIDKTLLFLQVRIDNDI